MTGFILQITQTGTMAADTMNKAAAAITPPPEQSMSLLDMAVKGGPILYPIAILSIAAI
jgi:hypothetical protein